MLLVEEKMGVGYTFHGGLKFHHGRLEGWDVPLKRT
jgi:hypothetical protein